MSSEMLDEDDVVESSEGNEGENAQTSEESSSADISDSQTSLAAKYEERARLQSEIEAFLARGGKIEVVEPNVVADPPKKPESNYGGQPI